MCLWTCTHVYISGSGMFALFFRGIYIYVQAFGYCRFLEKLENMLHSQSHRYRLSFLLFFFGKMFFIFNTRTCMRGSCTLFEEKTRARESNDLYPPPVPFLRGRFPLFEEWVPPLPLRNRCSEVCESDINQMDNPKRHWSEKTELWKRRASEKIKDRVAVYNSP